jgi:hypothetical protein
MAQMTVSRGKQTKTNKPRIAQGMGFVAGGQLVVSISLNCCTVVLLLVSSQLDAVLQLNASQLEA